MNKTLHPGIVVLVSFGIIFLIIGFILLNMNPSISPVTSRLDVNPSQPAPSTVTAEPQVPSWINYNNDKYNFTLQIPDGWNVQEFDLQNPYGGTLVAFSQNSLPCKTCTYVHDGFFSIKIYNQKSDPDFYAMFSQRMKAVGQVKGYQKIMLGQVTGVGYTNTLTVETHGWVYELTLDRNNGSGSFTDSNVFMKAASSLKFTYLEFN